MFMLDTSELQRHELRMLSGMARHVSLQTECRKYSEELGAFLKDKDNLLVDVVKALKRITNEWRSWNHKLFGGLSPKAYVASVDQICELLEWTEKTYPNIHQSEKDGSKSHWKFCIDTLKRYISAHAQMQRFYSKYIQCIYSPLTVYYASKHTRKTIAALRSTLNNWSFLQQTGAMINERYFTPESIQFFMEIMYYPGCRDFYLVLRLIPDLCMKAAECLQMARILLDANESDGFSRERAYIFEVWRPIQNIDTKSPWERKLCELMVEKNEVDEKLGELSQQQNNIIENLSEVNKKLEDIYILVKEKAESKKDVFDQINCLTQNLNFYKFQTKELKGRISHNTEKTHGCQNKKNHSNDTAVSCVKPGRSKSSDIDDLKIELKAIEFEVEKVQQKLTSKRNDLFIIDNSLKHEIGVEKQLIKAAESLAKEKAEVDGKLASVAMEERVIGGFVSRVKKNIKNAYMKLPPIATIEDSTPE